MKSCDSLALFRAFDDPEAEDDAVRFRACDFTVTEVGAPSCGGSTSAARDCLSSPSPTQSSSRRLFERKMRNSLFLTSSREKVGMFTKAPWITS